MIENFRAGTMERLGLGYDQLRSERPDLVYCSITGFGQDGPYRDRPAYDDVIQAASGWAALAPSPSWPRILAEAAVLLVWNDIHFYANHRLLHWAPLPLRGASSATRLKDRCAGRRRSLSLADRPPKKLRKFGGSWTGQVRRESARSGHLTI